MLLQRPMAPHPLALLALWAVAGAVPLPDFCEQEVNKIKDLLQVSCVGRGLTDLPAGLPPGTGILLLSSNHLARVSMASFQDLDNLIDLDLANNSLRAWEPGALLPALQQLILSHNALRSLPTLQGLPKLRRLALGHNAISQLPEGGFRALRLLQDLELQGNRLQRLAPAAFEGLVELKDLDLSDNLLEVLPQELLAGLGALQILRLERNRLQAVPGGFFQDHVFVYVYLSGNPWRCDCHLQYLREWLTENDISVYTRVRGLGQETTEHNPESVACQAPPQQKGRPVMYFQAACRELGDGDGMDGGEGTSDGPGSPAPPLTTTAASSTGALPPSSTTPGAFSTPMPTRSVVLTTTVSTSAATLTTHTPTTTTVTGPSTTSPPATPMTSTPASLGVARLLPNNTTFISVSTPATTFPGPAMPTSTCHFPMPPSQCLCTELPVRALQAPTQHRSPVPWASWLAARCCPLRLALSVASLILVGLPVLVVLCCLGRMHLSRSLPAVQGAAAVRGQQRQAATSKGWQELGSTKETRPLAGACIYHVCKEFKVAPVCHVTWLLVSLPGPAGQWPWERGTGTVSSYSLDHGRDTTGAVQGNSAASAL